MKLKRLVYKSTAFFDLDVDANLSFGAALTCSQNSKDTLFLRQGALLELRREVNKELRKVRGEING